MPTYDYKCNECGKVVEVMHSSSETPKLKCENDDCKGNMSKCFNVGPAIASKAVPTRRMRR